MNWYRMFFIQISFTQPPSMHWELPEHGRCCMQNNQLLTKSHVESEDNSILEHSVNWSNFVLHVVKVTGKVRREFTVRITWWTSKTVFCNGVLYCLTSGRPYSIIAYDLKTAIWTEVQVPPPEYLFCSFLIHRKDRLLLVGGVGSERICEHVHIWELKQGDEQLQWVEVEKMPQQYFQFFFKEKTASDLKCAGHGDLVYFFKDSHTQVVINYTPLCCHNVWFYST